MTDDQTETRAFLASPAAFGGTGPVRVVETHGALVFLAGDTALKLKRAVVYDYMDLGTVEKRRALLLRELELNRPAAPELYRDVLPVTRGPDGRLALGGTGAAVDWVLRMARFPSEAEMPAVIARGGFDDALAEGTGRMLAAYHAAAPVRHGPGAARMADILDELDRVFATFPASDGTAGVAPWLERARAALAGVTDLLDRRGAAGHVRRGHGDLHLANLVVLDGRPVPFDALEFSEELGTCDVLYDLAFLLMDLCHRGLDRGACGVLDAWLTAAARAEDEGLAALPLFLSVRAAIRAMVCLQTDAARGHRGETTEEIALYLAQAETFLGPAPARLIAVGGFSGTGKSVLARALAPGLGAAPGAVLIASDRERKGGAVDTRLAPAAYAPAQRGAVYDRLFARAATILTAGHSVILDATFLDPAHRQRAQALAVVAKVPFHGLWLDAPDAVLEARLAARRGDASDADAAVLRQQRQRGAGPLSWAPLDASGTPGATEAAARAILSGR
ncbi:AAA family ATPase [Oceaniglobus roseus]|uniref:bifunctional aminoglycoside phosphotransferase/ATP-binding protein n=1 Tax=Oceaniglobus roseus TaxID=1737570 RepID=UPI000C7F3424|nr:bifunctional aminoglycoside phosphotransferase/ATP-binding protein [Kandeliimicrobium roseum]